MQRGRLATERLQSAARIAAPISILVIAALSLMPKESLERTGAPPLVEHFVAYAGSAALAAAAWPRAPRISIFVGYLILAAALEFLQRWTPDRSPDLFTALASGVGAVAGALLAERLGKRAAANQRAVSAPREQIAGGEFMAPGPAGASDDAGARPSSRNREQFVASS